jgi:predicted permease
VDLHRVRRLAHVLVASQLRSGRAGSDPKSFFGRGRVILLYDLLAVGLVAYLTQAVLGSVLRAEPSIGHQILGMSGTLLLPGIPTISVGIVLVAGVMFELTATARFAMSDAVNWLPISPSEYVTASAIAIAYTYSLGWALAAGVGLGLALSAGSLTVAVAVAVAILLGALGLLEGGLLVEMVRAVTQRAGMVLSGRTARVTLVVRAAVVLVVLIALQVVFNPVLLFGLVQATGPLREYADFVPLFWNMSAVQYAYAGDLLWSALFAAGALAVVFAFALAAVGLRSRYWVPVPAELTFGAATYGRAHPWLGRLGFGPAEASLLAKDLHGLFRRRELVPMLLLPIVLGFVGFFGLGSTPGGAGATTVVLWIAWVTGFFCLLLASTSIGQERRGFQNLYAHPIASRSVFRAKAGLVLLLGLLVGAVATATAAARSGLSPSALAATLVIVVATVLEGTFLGLAFATRYSDFQERPRPQFVRPMAMLAAMLVGTFLLLGTIVPTAIWVGAPGIGPGPFVLLGTSVAIAALIIPLAAWSARRGMDRLLLELPF